MSIPTVLEKILARKAEEVAERRARASFAEVEAARTGAVVTEAPGPSVRVHVAIALGADIGDDEGSVKRGGHGRLPSARSGS